MALLKNKIQNALDEARMLVLGSQVFLGFQFRAAIEPGFERLPPWIQRLRLVSLGLLLVTLALLLFPGSYHRIVTGGEDTPDLHETATVVMDWALLPLAIALSLDLFSATVRFLGQTGAIVFALGGLAAAVVFWYGLEFVIRKQRSYSEGGMDQDHFGRTTLSDKIKHVLTEARVILPGAQALLGFQLAATFMDGFDKLPDPSKIVHLVSLGLISLAIIFLIAPAAFHRIVEDGEETSRMHQFSSLMILLGLIALGGGIALDSYVIAKKILASDLSAVAFGGSALILFYGLWFGVTAIFRRHRKQSIKRPALS